MKKNVYVCISFVLILADVRLFSGNLLTFSLLRNAIIFLGSSKEARRGQLFKLFVNNNYSKVQAA